MPGRLRLPMIGTAEVVAKRYNISREYQDEYSFQSQQRTAAAQAAGKYDDEIVACNATMAVVDKETKEVSFKDVVAKVARVACDETEAVDGGDFVVDAAQEVGEGRDVLTGEGIAAVTARV